MCHWFDSSRRHHLCGSGSVVERHLAKVNVASSNLVFRSKHKRRNNASFVIWRHSQVVRQRPAKPLSPVQVWVAPPTKNRLTIRVRRFLSFFHFLVFPAYYKRGCKKTKFFYTLLVLLGYFLMLFTQNIAVVQKSIKLCL